MRNNLINSYHSKLVADQEKTNKVFLSQRVFMTVNRFLELFTGQTLSGRILDLGCGDGSFVDYCNNHNLDAKGVDIADGIDFESDKLPYRDNQFSFVFMGSVLEHLNNPSNILNEVKRVLVKGGVLIVITPNIDRVKFHFYDDPTHVRPYNPTNISRLMEMFGLKRIAIGLWTVGKSSFVWKWPLELQFLCGRLLPFAGLNKQAPSFLRGKSKTMLCVFRKEK